MKFFILSIIVVFLSLFVPEYNKASNIKPIAYNICINESNNSSKCICFSDNFINELGSKTDIAMQLLFQGPIDSRVDMALSRSLIKCDIPVENNPKELAKKIQTKLYYKYIINTRPPSEKDNYNDNNESPEELLDKLGNTYLFPKKN